jgi:hypothetical protein
MHLLSRSSVSVSVVIAGMLLPNILGSAEEVVGPLSLGSINIPSSLGHVTGRLEVTNPTTQTKTILIVQDAHVNYEAQKNIAGILEKLVNQQHLKLILVEGDTGDINLDYLRRYGPPQIRAKIADQFMREGVFAGHEYLSVVSHEPLILWGIEDSKLYQNNYQAFLLSQEIEKKVSPQLRQLRQILEQLKAQLLSEPVKELEAHARRFEASEETLSNYILFLVEQAKQSQLSENKWSQLAAFAEATTLEQGVILEKIGSEQNALIQQLRPQLTAEELGQFAENTMQLRTKSIAPLIFYQKLTRLADAYEIPMGEYPHLSAYMRMLQIKSKIQPQELLSEIVLSKRSLLAALAGSVVESRLLEISDDLGLFERLAQLKWNPEDAKTYAAQKGYLNIAALIPFLQEQVQAAGQEFDFSGNWEQLDHQLKEMVDFYSAAMARDDAIVRHSIEKMIRENQSAAAMVLGGFHTEHIGRLFQEQGIQVIVITPKTSASTDETLYHFWLKTKNQQLEVTDSTIVLP